MVAEFPAIEPTTRAWDFGTYAMSEAPAVGGGAIRFSHAADAVGMTLTLGFEGLADDDLQLIRDHYYGQQGGYLSFLLPAVIWLGHTSTTDVAPATDRWIYANPPDEGDALQGGFYDVTVTLRHVGPEPGEFYG